MKQVLWFSLQFLSETFLILRITQWYIITNARRVFTQYTRYSIGPVAQLVIATDHGLDGPESNPGVDEIFRPSRSALGPTQPPVQCVPGLFRGKVRPGRAADHSPTF